MYTKRKKVSNNFMHAFRSNPYFRQGGPVGDRVNSCFPWQAIFNIRSSSIKRCLPSYPSKVYSIKVCPPLKFVFNLRSSQLQWQPKKEATHNIVILHPKKRGSLVAKKFSNTRSCLVTLYFWIFVKSFSHLPLVSKLLRMEQNNFT